MTRRVVFAGGPQTRALARIYRAEFAAARGDAVAFIDVSTLQRESAGRAMAASEALVMEVDESGDRVPAGALPKDPEILRVPTVSADFLWPFAGQPHPRNAGSFPMQDGPYPAEHGDSFLDRMLREGVGEDDAVSRYLALDMAQEADLDGMLRRRLSHQAELDAMTGHDLAGFIEDGFREHYLFASRERPRLPLFRRIAAVVFDKLGAGDGGATLRQVPGLVSAQPIHPGVIAHFGLTAPEAGQRYPMQDEGLFTFEEYCRRYLRFAWNESLHAGIALSRAKPAEALPLLRQGLEASPLSRRGKRALKHATAAARGAVHGAAPPLDDDELQGADALDEDTIEEAAARAEAEPIAARHGPEHIEGLPGLLSHGDGLAGMVERPFAAMPETMPPPPMRPELPPEPDPEAAGAPAPKRGLFGKLTGMFKAGA